MIASNRIWAELKQAKANILCLQKYTDKKRRNNRIYYGFIAVASSIGTLGTPIYSNMAWIATTLIALVSIAKSVMPNILQTEPELSELDKLSDFYSSYMNRIEKIWFDFDHDYVDEEHTMQCFFDLKESECCKQSLLNKGIRDISKKMQDKIDIAAKNYINEVYFKINEEN